MIRQKKIVILQTNDNHKQMNFHKIQWDNIGVRAEISSYAPDCKTQEHHIILHIDANGDLFTQQYNRLKEAEKMLKNIDFLQHSSIIYKKYFFSDIANQAPLVQENEPCALSFIQQPPLDGSKLALLIYMQDAEKTEKDDNALIVYNKGYQHIWSMGMAETMGDSFTQTANLLEKYEGMLEKHGANIADNCIRTWFFVRDVDTQYHGMVVARKENFARNGLTQDTHYIASTGIGGIPESTKSILMLDTYALKGFSPEQQKYLYAPTHLNPTSEYGVTFERGTLMEYGDRAHVFISGTASINNKGEVVHIGDIVKQTQRMWENVDTLLKEGQSSFDDVMAITVYLRDPADYDTVKGMFTEKFPNTPFIITLAPVCRPQWLIEMECMAISSRNLSQYKDF